MNSLEQLVEDAAEAKGFNMAEHDRTTAESDKPISKSARIRDFMKQNPEARNVDIAKALEVYGVKTADVANVKAQLKRKAGKPGKSKMNVRAVKTNKPDVAAAPANEAAEPAIEATIQLDLLESGVEFIRKAGGINEAIHVLGVIRRIRSL